MSLGIFGVALRSRVRVARGSELGGLCALGGGSPRHARKARVARDLGPPNRSGTPAFQWTVEICQHPGDRPSGRSTTDGQSITQVCGRLRGYLRGWKEYFRLADTPYILAKVDGWIRHRLRALHLKHWKRGPPIYRELRAWGADKGRVRHPVALSSAARSVFSAGVARLSPPDARVPR